MAELDKEHKQGLLYGSLLAAGIAAAQGRNLSDAIYKAALGGSSAYTGGMEKIYDQKRKELEEERQQELIKASQMRSAIDLGQYQMQEKQFPLEQAAKQKQLEASTFQLGKAQKEQDALEAAMGEIRQTIYNTGKVPGKEELMQIGLDTNDINTLYKAIGMEDMVEVEIQGKKVKVPAEKLLPKTDTSLNENELYWQVENGTPENKAIAQRVIAHKLADDIKRANATRQPNQPTDFEKKIKMAKDSLIRAGKKNPTEDEIAAKYRDMFPSAQGAWNPFNQPMQGTPGITPKKNTFTYDPNKKAIK